MLNNVETLNIFDPELQLKKTKSATKKTDRIIDSIKRS